MTDTSIVTDVAVLTDAQELIHPLTVEDYHRMIEAGIFDEDDRVELLDGALIEMSPEGPPHAEVIARLARWLIEGTDGDEWAVRVGSPVTLPPISEPQPDFAVVPRADSNFRSHPGEAQLVVEVAMTSLRKDRVRKARIYAEAGLPRYWIVDLVHGNVIVHGSPAPDGYRELAVVEPPALLDPDCCGLPPLDLGALFAGR
jgi:Uma2 family endonuclease